MSKSAEKGNDFIIEYPQHEEDVTLVFNDSFPIDTIFIGQTYPFSSYKIHRRETAGRHLFEFVLGGKGEIEIDGKKIPLTAGDTFFLGKGSQQDYISDKKDPLKKRVFPVFSKLISVRAVQMPEVSAVGGKQLWCLLLQ